MFSLLVKIVFTSTIFLTFTKCTAWYQLPSTIGTGHFKQEHEIHESHQATPLIPYQVKMYHFSNDSHTPVNRYQYLEEKLHSSKDSIDSRLI